MTCGSKARTSTRKRSPRHFKRPTKRRFPANRAADLFVMPAARLRVSLRAWCWLGDDDLPERLRLRGCATARFDLGGEVQDVACDVGQAFAEVTMAGAGVENQPRPRDALGQNAAVRRRHQLVVV